MVADIEDRPAVHVSQPNTVQCLRVKEYEEEEGEEYCNSCPETSTLLCMHTHTNTCTHTTLDIHNFFILGVA